MLGLGLGSSADSAITAVGLSGTSQVISDLMSISRAWGNVSHATDQAANSGQRLNSWGNAFIMTGGTIAGVLGLVARSSLKSAGDMAVTEIAFKKVMGSAEAAQAKIKELKEFDRESPFNFTESVKGAQRLLAVGFAAKDLKSVLTDIGDAAAGTGGSTDDFMGIGRAIGQMKNKGKVSMEEINQLGDRSINALAILQKQLKLTDEQKAKLMSGDMTLSSDVAVPALLKGFRELYGGSMKEMSKTLPGQVSNLVSAIEQLNQAVGELFSKDGTGAIGQLTKLTDKTTEFVKNNPELVKTALTIAGIGAASLIAVGGLLKIVGVVKGAKGLIGGVAGGLGGSNVGVMTVNAAVVNINGGLGGGLPSSTTNGVPKLPGAAGASWAARMGITGSTAFGMGAVGTGAVLTAGAIAAYKLPGYMRDAANKSDEEMSQSSDPLQRFHSWAGNKLANSRSYYEPSRLLKRIPLLGYQSHDLGPNLQENPMDLSHRLDEERKQLWAQITNSKTFRQRRENEIWRKWVSNFSSDETRRVEEMNNAFNKSEIARGAGLVSNAPKIIEQRHDWDEKTRAIAGLFGLTQRESSARDEGRVTQNRDDSTTVTLPARRADQFVRGVRRNNNYSMPIAI